MHQMWLPLIAVATRLQSRKNDANYNQCPPVAKRHRTPLPKLLVKAQSVNSILNGMNATQPVAFIDITNIALAALCAYRPTGRYD